MSNPIANKYTKNILDVFGGADGGVAFATMFHSHIPAFVANADNSPNVQELLAAFEQILWPLIGKAE